MKEPQLFTEDFFENRRYKYYQEHGTIYDSTTDKDVCIVYAHQGKEAILLVLNALENLQP